MDDEVLAVLRARGPGEVTPGEVQAALPGATLDGVRASLMRLHRAGTIFLMQWMGDYGTEDYVLRLGPFA